MRLLQENDGQVPTWNANNSLISTETPVTAYSGLPLLYGSPTDWSNLYTALRISQNINTQVSPGRKTIISLDMQLYIKCIKRKAEDNVNRNFVFRVGELHTVFASLKATGKYIDESGIDQSLIEADIYGPTTIQQIKEGKHMKRGIDAYTTVYLALYKLYLAKLFEQYPEEFELSVKDAISSQCNLLQSRSEIENHSLKDGHMDLIDTLGNIEFQEKQEEFDNSLTKQAKFLRNFMKMFESLLLFVRATRQKDWELHLMSLNGLVKYFFAHGLQNYARMVPVYLSEMFALKEQDPELWEYFKQGNFSVNKTRIPFSAIGADHGIEHENRVMKVVALTESQITRKLYIVLP